MSYRNVLVDHSQSITTITMNRPERRNALSLDHMRELIDAFRAVGGAGEARAVILAAAGPVFSAGHDFADLVECDLTSVRRLFAACSELMATIQSIPQPVVAQVQGLATAAGCQLVASCDLAVAAETAAFATPGGKGGWFCTTPMVAVSRAVGRKRALELLFTGDPIDARTAAEWGLVNRAVPPERLAEETRRLARAASRGSTVSKAIGKQAFYAQIDMDQRQAYAYASEVMAMTVLSEDGREAVRSFLEKRPGSYDRRRRS